MVRVSESDESLMSTQKKRTKEQRKARRKTQEKPPIARAAGNLMVQTINRQAVEIAELEKKKLALKVRIAELEAMLSPIVWQANRFALAMKNASPNQTVSLTHRVEFLRKAREVLANNPPGKKKDYPDFTTIARHTIEDLGKSLLDIGTLAEEFDRAYEAGYEHRRSIELARLNGEKVDDE